MCGRRDISQIKEAKKLGSHPKTPTTGTVLLAGEGDRLRIAV